MKIMPVHMEPTRSGWFAALGPRPAANQLNTDIACDYLVVGGGWMGLHCARRLGELAPDARVVLVDAGRIGDGAAGRCAGFAIDLAHNPRNKHFAEDKKGNEEEFHVNSEGIDYLRQAVEELGVDCDWDPSGKYHAAATERGQKCLTEMSVALKQIGKEHRWLGREEIQARTGSKHYFAAIHTPGTQAWPRWRKRLAIRIVWNCRNTWRRAAVRSRNCPRCRACPLPTPRGVCRSCGARGWSRSSGAASM
ncbi:FAD-binding oxidoreductase [Paracoccus versutus]|nr:FAD-binding oxidoreductase [Paracoccus versutus]